MLYDNFKEQGYIVVKNLFSDQDLTPLISAFDEVKSNKYHSLYYSQSHHNWRNVESDLDKYNTLSTSMLNFTDSFWLNSLARHGRSVLQSPAIESILKKVSPCQHFNMWQNMLFEKSTATVDHIDSWYLDTDITGFLVGAWIALENIDKRGGAFHVYPKSHLHEGFSDKIHEKSHDEMIKYVNYVSTLYSKKSLYINKGDVILWHPCLIHGSSPQQEPGFTRLSLTAHYHPSQFHVLKGSVALGQTKFQKQIRRLLSIIFFRNKSKGYPISSRRSPLMIAISNMRGFLQYYLLPFLNKPHMLMNRTNYK